MPGACVGIRISPALGHTHRLIANDGDPKSSKPCGSKPLGSCLGNIHFPASPTLGTLVPLQPLQLCCSGVLPLGAVTFPHISTAFSHGMHAIPQHWEVAAPSWCILLQRWDLASIPQSMAWCQLVPQPRCSDQALVGGCVGSDSDPKRSPVVDTNVYHAHIISYYSMQYTYIYIYNIYIYIYSIRSAGNPFSFLG